MKVPFCKTLVLVSCLFTGAVQAAIATVTYDFFVLGERWAWMELSSPPAFGDSNWFALPNADSSILAAGTYANSVLPFPIDFDMSTATYAPSIIISDFGSELDGGLLIVTDMMVTVPSIPVPLDASLNALFSDVAGADLVQVDVNLLPNPIVLAGDWKIKAVPIPAALPLFGSALGLMGLVGFRRRNSQQAR